MNIFTWYTLRWGRVKDHDRPTLKPTRRLNLVTGTACYLQRAGIQRLDALGRALQTLGVRYGINQRVAQEVLAGLMQFNSKSTPLPKKPISSTA